MSPSLPPRLFLVLLHLLLIHPCSAPARPHPSHIQIRHAGLPRLCPTAAPKPTRVHALSTTPARPRRCARRWCSTPRCSGSCRPCSWPPSPCSGGDRRSVGPPPAAVPRRPISPAPAATTILCLSRTDLQTPGPPSPPGLTRPLSPRPLSAAFPRAMAVWSAEMVWFRIDVPPQPPGLTNPTGFLW